MSSFQALWSVGGLAGGFLTSVTLGLGSTPEINLTCVRLTDSAARPALLFSPDARRRIVAGSRRVGSAFACLAKRCFIVAIFTFIALFSEGVLQDWAAVYMRQVVAVPVSDCGSRLRWLLYRDGLGPVRRRPRRGLLWRALCDALERRADHCRLS